MSQGRIYPAWLYYTCKGGAASYHLSPPGRINVPRLAEGLPAFEVMQGDEAKPKSLILADCFAINWSREKLEAVVKKLGELMDANFKLYIWQQDNEVNNWSEGGEGEGEVNVLTKKMLQNPYTETKIETADVVKRKSMEFDSDYVFPDMDRIIAHNSIYKPKIRARITVAFPSEIIRIAAKDQGLTRNEILILDDYWLDTLLDPALPANRPRGLHVQEYLRLNDQAQCLKLLEVLKTSEPRLSYFTAHSFVPSVFTSNPSFESKTLLNPLFNPYTIQYQELIIRDQDYDLLFPRLLSQGFHTLKHKKYTFNESNLSEIKKLMIIRTVAYADLATVVNRCPKLQELVISDITIQGCREFKPLNNIHAIHIINPIKWEGLLTLLNCTPGIKRLEVKGIQGSFPQSSAIKETTIEQITINESTSADQLLQLILLSPKIKKLKICSSIHGQISKLPPLNYLEDITICDTEENSITSSLIAVSPNIKKLHFNCELKLTSKLEKLETVICPSVITTETYFNLKSFFTLTPHLKEVAAGNVNLLNIKNSAEDDSLFFMGTLNNIEILDYIEIPIQPNHIRNISLICPKVKTLKLKNFSSDFFKSSELDEIKVNTVQELYIQNSSILEDEFTLLIKLFPQCKKVNFEGSENLTEFLFSLKGVEFHFWQLKNKRILEYEPSIKIEYTDFQSHDATQKTPSSLPQDLVHNLERYRVFIPNKTEFKFKGINKTKAQGMIIEKLSQYLKLTDQHLAAISKIQDGICESLNFLFIEYNENKKNWDDLINPILEWNGQKSSLNQSLKALFEKIYAAVMKSNLKRSANDYYLGDDAIPWLEKTHQPCIISNPWHSISMVPAKSPTSQESGWIIYDPNYLDGPKFILKQHFKNELHVRLGKLIFIVTDNTLDTKPIIDNPNHFIRDGGLLVICKSNIKDRKYILNVFKTKKLNPESLAGVLLRDPVGKPAWAVALKKRDPEITAFVTTLLEQFIQTHSSNYMHQLEKSLSTTEPSEKHEIISLLSTLHLQNNTVKKDSSLLSSLHLKTNPVKQEEKKADPAPITAICDSIQSSSRYNYYARQLEPWRQKAPEEVSLTIYCDKLLQDKTNKKQLVQLTSNSELTTLQIALQKQCRTSRPVFCVHSPKDLMCSSPWVKRDERNHGTLQRFGGPLYDFLQANKHTDPILIIDYSQFTHEKIVATNTVIDKTPSIDGQSLPPNMKVIGLINTESPTYYKGSDFFSRFGKAIERCPVSKSELVLSPLPIVNATALTTPTSPIYLYGKYDWKERLLGTWKIKGKQLIFEEGVLKKALDSKLPLEIRHGLWGDPQFQHFWQQAIAIGYIEHAGFKHVIPPDLKLVINDQYDWSYQDNIHFEKGLSDADILVLNPTKLYDFFSQYKYNRSEKLLDTVEGHIALAKDKTLDVNLTRDLSESDWAELLAVCHQYNVKLKVHYTPSIVIQTQFKKVDQTIETKQSDPTQHTQVILSNDIDITVYNLTEKSFAPWQVIDVSECDPSDLIYRLNAEVDSHSNSFVFDQKNGVLLTAFEQKKNIILKGYFSKQLKDTLATYILQRASKNGANRKFFIITSDKTSFDYAQLREHHVEIADKEKYLLSKGFSLTEIRSLDVDKTLPACKLEAYLLKNKAADDVKQETAQPSLGSTITAPLKTKKNDPWEGVDDISDTVYSLSETVNFKESKKITADFNKARIDAICKLLWKANAPYVFLTGLSGVGKSTFIDKDFTTWLTKHNGKIFHGESKLYEWAKDQSLKDKVLVIDEANLSQCQWSQFEGLYNNPPSILLDGVYHTLTKQHKVIFAGNPVRDGGERKSSPFFERHGNAILFTPLPKECIYEHILKPIFDGFLSEILSQEMSDIILQAYHFICQCSHDKVLITPRDLEMMVLLTLSYAKTRSLDHSNLKTITKNYVYVLGNHLVPDHKKNEYEEKFKPLVTEFKHIPLPVSHSKPKSKTTTPFLITPSLEAPSHLINDVLTLRQLRCQTFIDQAHGNVNEIKNETFYYGGLGGIVIQGEPGVGKSDLFEYLIANHYDEQKWPPESEVLSKEVNIFYRMPASMDPKEKEKLLLRASSEGAIVLADEMNSSPLMERVSNSLLMGKTLNNKRPRPGFLLLMPQNTIDREGRQAQSPALSRRCITMKLPAYPHKELVAILKAKAAGHELRHADKRIDEMVSAFEAKLKEAKTRHVSPEPTLRDLVKLLEHEIETEKSILQEEKLRASLTVPTIQETYARYARSSLTKHTLFKGVTNVKEALQILKSRLEKHPHGATKQTLDELRSTYHLG